MPEENDPTPAPSPPDEPTLFDNLPPDELFVRAMRTVKMTSGAHGAWQPPSIEEAAHPGGRANPPEHCPHSALASLRRRR